MSTDVTLRLTQTNNVFELIENANLNPNDFTWGEVDSGERQRRYSQVFRASVLTHTPTNYYIIFGGWKTQYSPGQRVKVEAYDHMASWVLQLNFCGTWLNELRKEIDAPDLWATLSLEHALSDAASSMAENRPFTPDERLAINRSLDEIKGFVLDGNEAQKQQTAFIEEQFTYLRDAAERLGRKDWLTLTVGALFGLVVTLAMDPPKARGLLSIAATLLQWVWGHTQGFIEGT